MYGPVMPIDDGVHFCLATAQEETRHCLTALALLCSSICDWLSNGGDLAQEKPPEHVDS